MQDRVKQRTDWERYWGVSTDGLPREVKGLLEAAATCPDQLRFIVDTEQNVRIERGDLETIAKIQSAIDLTHLMTSHNSHFGDTTDTVKPIDGSNLSMIVERVISVSIDSEKEDDFRSNGLKDEWNDVSSWMGRVLLAEQSSSVLDTQHLVWDKHTKRIGALARSIQGLVQVQEEKGTVRR